MLRRGEVVYRGVLHSILVFSHAAHRTSITRSDVPGARPLAAQGNGADHCGAARGVACHVSSFTVLRGSAELWCMVIRYGSHGARWHVWLRTMHVGVVVDIVTPSADPIVTFDHKVAHHVWWRRELLGVRVCDMRAERAACYRKHSSLRLRSSVQVFRLKAVSLFSSIAGGASDHAHQSEPPD